MKTGILAITLAIVTVLITSSAYAGENRSSKDGKGTVIHSVVDGHNTMTAYNKRGKWIYTIQQYSLDNLNKSFADRIKSFYYEYSVTGIQKVEQPVMETVYVVHLENEKSIKLIRLTNDEMELVQDLIKN